MEENRRQAQREMVEHSNQLELKRQWELEMEREKIRKDPNSVNMETQPIVKGKGLGRGEGTDEKNRGKSVGFYERDDENGQVKGRNKGPEHSKLASEAAYVRFLGGQ